eukprot:EG_transcript_34923
MAEGAKRWAVVNDGVMGGRSSSSVTDTKEGLLFSGDVNVDGGGFASCRARLAGPLAGATGLTITARHVAGDSTRYKLQLKAPGFDVPSWQSDFHVAPDHTPTTARLPFSHFVPTFRGRPVGPPGIPSEQLVVLGEVGVMLSFLTDRGLRDQPGFSPGPFGLLIEDIAAYQ